MMLATLTGRSRTAWVPGTPSAPSLLATPAQSGAASLPSGTVLSGRYRIEQPLGAGAFAVVFSAWDLSLHRRVAVKVYDAATGGQVSADEARLQAACQHPNLMPLHDAGSDPLQGVVFLVLPLYPGSDLAAASNRLGPMAFRMAVNIGDQVCSALEFLGQRRGIVHGDIKPSNIWLTPSGAALLMDFNLTGLLSRSGGLGFGTPGYTAPEALQGRRDTRSDLFSLGCVLYQCLAGVAPFADDAAVQAGRFTPLRRLRPEIRPALEAVIHRVLAADPEQRYQSAREFQTALRYPSVAFAAPRLAGALGWAGRTLLTAAGATLRGAWRVVCGSLRLLLRGTHYALRHPRQALVQSTVAVVVAGFTLSKAALYLQTYPSVAALSGPAVLLLLMAVGARRRSR